MKKKRRIYLTYVYFETKLVLHVVTIVSFRLIVLSSEHLAEDWHCNMYVELIIVFHSVQYAFVLFYLFVDHWDYSTISTHYKVLLLFDSMMMMLRMMMMMSVVDVVEYYLLLRRRRRKKSNDMRVSGYYRSIQLISTSILNRATYSLNYQNRFN